MGIVSSLINLSYATQTPRPMKCPSPSAIQLVGVSQNAIENNKLWFTGRRHQNYDTTTPWTFLLGNIVANNAHDAYVKGTAALAHLSYPTGPLAGPLDKWMCVYSTLEGYTGVVLTTPLALELATKYVMR